MFRIRQERKFILSLDTIFTHPKKRNRRKKGEKEKGKTLKIYSL